jgi:lysophospholipase L1-like esterase
LSEPGHAGGRFPRPVLSERLSRVLTQTRPDLVIACYGINCGIYQPLDESRFRKYQEGIHHLVREVRRQSAQILLLTPPVYDDHRSRLDFSYDEVMQTYAAWLMDQREKEGWQVIDLHSAMRQELRKRRQESPEFTFQPDAVHPDASGHLFISQVLIGAVEKDVDGLADIESILATIRQRLDIRRDAWLTATGHQRPGLRPGLSLAEVEQRAAGLTRSIRRSLQTGSSAGQEKR